MTGIYLEDGTSIHFIQDRYTIHFEGKTVTFLLKRELFEHPHRETKIILDYANMIAYFEWKDGHNETLKFKGVI